MRDGTRCSWSRAECAWPVRICARALTFSSGTFRTDRLNMPTVARSLRYRWARTCITNGSSLRFWLISANGRRRPKKDDGAVRNSIAGANNRHVARAVSHQAQEDLPMASPQESEILTRVWPGTPMGNLMRQYWIPAAMSSELTADGPPLRLMLLGERLLAFPASSGRVGVMDHRCPHRCASLFFGRNEDNGLRCVYHGWKFDTEGRCVDMPNVPPEHDYKDKVRARAYPAVERSGLVWVYMGPRNPAPGLPMFEAALLEGEDLQITFSQRECNYLQALEGDIDTTHLGFLHLGALNPEDLKRDHNNLFPIANRHPDLRVKRTAWGTMYGARRLVEDKIYWRFAHFLLPFWTMIPNGTFGEHIGVRAWVPMDDTHVMFVFLRWNGYRVHNRMLRDGGRAAGIGGRGTFLPNRSDLYGRFRSIANAANDYLIDREVQR